MILNDLEPPKCGFLVIFSDFWLQPTFKEWIAQKCLEMVLDNLRVTFLA